MEATKVTIYLKSGQSFQVILKDYKIRSSNGILTSMEWNSASLELPHPAYLNIDDVSAIIAENFILPE